MKATVALIILTLSMPVWCEDVIDLGSLEIDGETRRPMISYSEASQNVVKALGHQLSNNAKLYAAKLAYDEESGNRLYGKFTFSSINTLEIAQDFKFSPISRGQ